MPVGWNCTNSMSELASPARATIAVPSPVQVWAEVQLNNNKSDDLSKSVIPVLHT
jgi:hypothetical protein